MDKNEIEKIVRDVLKNLDSKNSPKVSSVEITTGTSGKFAPDDKKVTVGTSGKPVSSPDRVTIGTAGKVFTLPEGSAKTGCPLLDGTGSCAECQQCVIKRPDDVSAIVTAGADRISALHPGAPGGEGYNREIASMIDHTLLKANATGEQIGKLCEEAKKYNFASVCVNPAYVALASDLLKGSPVKVTTVVGFPLGATTPTAKAIETRDAIAAGADEIDMVINVGALKSGNYQIVLDDIKAVREASRGHILKVIIETALLTNEEKVKACELAKQAGADFVKTSTGFSTGGATVEDVKLMRSVVGPSMGVKASGGIRSLEDAEAMKKAGATRIGASASVKIVAGEKSEGKGY
ncbi:MAG: deoxyribose-phosphate aldolase [Elusimicrobia bacterium]|nr:deoxyribose-phosphate aldolase [Elusimicrobiota bacterium]